MLRCLVIQEVKEVLDSQWDWTTGAEDHCEKVVHKFLQCPLKNRKEEVDEGESDSFGGEVFRALCNNISCNLSLHYFCTTF